MLVDGAALQNKNYYHFPNENTVEIKNLSLQDYISIYNNMIAHFLTLRNLQVSQRKQIQTIQMESFALLIATM